MYFHMLCCAASAAGSFEFQVCTTEVCVAVVGYFKTPAYRRSNGAFGSLPLFEDHKAGSVHTHTPS